MKKRKSEKLLWRKLRFTAMILILYLLGRRIPVYGIDADLYLETIADASTFLRMTIGGDVRKISVFALGISPYMIASIVIMMVTSIRKAVSRPRISMKKIRRMLWILALFLALFQGISSTGNMTFSVDPWWIPVARGIAALQMTAGAMLILWMSEQNKDYGFGGQTILILVNLFESIVTMVKGCTSGELAIPAAFSVGAMFVTLIMETSEFRIPVQRISIYSIYEEKNYQAFKLNPVGVMPAMFATAIFTLLQLLMVALRYLLRDVLVLGPLVEALKLDCLLGIWVYIGIIYALTIGFSVIFLSPGEVAEQMLKSNDSVCNVPSGNPTKKYLTTVVIVLAFISATIMSICVGVPLLMQYYLDINPGLLMLPSVSMMLTGVCVNIIREWETIVSYDSYRIFL